jgi:hypothetical protein
MASAFGSTFSPEVMAATTLRWPGMIQKNTLALMAVAIIAPTSRKAARPANQWQASQDATHTSASTSAPTMASPFFFWPKSRQIASYSSQNTTRKASATPMAAAGAQSMRDLSIR